MKLVILGADSAGREVADIALCTGRYQSIVFLDDAPALQNLKVMSLPVIGEFRNFAELLSSTTRFFVAVGSPSVRCQWMTTVREAGGQLATITHPAAYVSPSATVGVNTMIDFGCHIGPNVAMGDGNLLWSSVVISHDSTIGNCCFFGPTATIAGFTHIGNSSMFGCGAKLHPGILIGNRVVVGMGTIVRQSVPNEHVIVPGAAPIQIVGKDPERIFFGPTRLRR